MAPSSKKKKKPAANAARGFATTSVTSKSKVQELEGQKLENESVTAIDVDAKAPSNDATRDELPQKADPGYTNLTPEELEAQLEESELQMIVEKHAERIKKDNMRQISRLQTEKRLLRSQAERLSLSNWLPDELVDLILSHPTASRQELQVIHENKKSPLSSEELSIKLWGLSKTLEGLGIPAKHVQDTIQHLAQQELSGMCRVNETSKETQWGLDDAFDCLAGYASYEDLPDYETSVVRSQKLPEYATDIRFDEPKSRLLSSLGLENGQPKVATHRLGDAETIVVFFST